MRHLVFALLMALLLSGAAIGAGPGVNAFITNSGSGSISIVDTATNALSAVSVGATTQGVAMDPKGARAYVAGTSGLASSLYAIDTKSKAVVGSVVFPSTVKSLFGVAVSPDGTRLFVTHGVKPSPRASVQGAVSVVNVSSTGALSLGATMMVGGVATGVAVSPSGDRVYVANGAQRVSVIDAAQFGVLGATPVNVVVIGSSFVGAAVSPDGTRLYAADAANSKLLVIDTTLIGTLADPVVASVTVGTGPFGVAVSTNGKRIFVANMASNNVTVIDPALIGTGGNPVVATMTVGDGPHGVAVTSDSAKAYVVNRFDNTMSVLNGTTGALLATVKLPDLSFPVGFGNFLTPALSITVVIDVVPDVVNLKKQGTVPVIVYGSESFDVHTADLTTIRLNGWPVKIKPNGEPMANYGDFNGDGLDDVMVHFSMDGAQDVQTSSSDSTATLEGQTTSGVSFQGADSVKFIH